MRTRNGRVPTRCWRQPWSHEGSASPARTDGHDSRASAWRTLRADCRRLRAASAAALHRPIRHIRLCRSAALAALVTRAAQYSKRIRSSRSTHWSGSANRRCDHGRSRSRACSME